MAENGDAKPSGETPAKADGSTTAGAQVATVAKTAETADAEPTRAAQRGGGGVMAVAVLVLLGLAAWFGVDAVDKGRVIAAADRLTAPMSAEDAAAAADHDLLDTLSRAEARVTSAELALDVAPEGDMAQRFTALIAVQERIADVMESAGEAYQDGPLDQRVRQLVDAYAALRAAADPDTAARAEAESSATARVAVMQGELTRLQIALEDRAGEVDALTRERNDLRAALAAAETEAAEAADTIDAAPVAVAAAPVEPRTILAPSASVCAVDGAALVCTLHFETGSAAFDKLDEGALEEIRVALADRPDAAVVAKGFADPVPPRQGVLFDEDIPLEEEAAVFNTRLATRRGAAVAARLEALTGRVVEVAPGEVVDVDAALPRADRLALYADARRVEVRVG